MAEITSQELVRTIQSISNREEITWVHFEGRIPDVLAASIPTLRRILPHATISIEFEKPARPGLLDLLPLADVAFISHAFYKHFNTSLTEPSSTAFPSFAALRERNPKATFIVTGGEEGAWYSLPYDQGHVPARKVKVVDTTGAGDTFIAGFVYFVSSGEAVASAVEKAVGLASTKCAREGFQGVWDAYNNATDKSCRLTALQ